MKSLLLLLLTSAATVSAAQAQATTTTAAAPDPQKDVRVVQASCGQCQLGLPGKSCDLAVRFDGKAYFVDGTTIDSHGDAHAKDGFCQTIRRAEVQGKVVDNRFKATYFKLLPAAGKSN
ncbi:hypothetical protein HNQ93_003655 [Hymenobacter luteus]|uniref:Glutaminyl-tRNA synthetase n=2 Tax=Hymenobacter TaxID=89966 RepID=A0A7W9T4I8_9BACT|nr:MULTISPECIES: DUF6370 family protein [Hymenobacter]MBB4602888.1 hypothetical protein [Hymenobacter latericoloratus]MBB6060780.1 hypothetical protein [Hymenobacter luteus]